jgi:hypothetical protein
MDTTSNYIKTNLHSKVIKTGNDIYIVKTGYLGDDDMPSDECSNDETEKAWVTKIPFSKTETNDNINDI